MRFPIGHHITALLNTTTLITTVLPNAPLLTVRFRSMCGVGTLPFLGASWFRDVFWMGGEIDGDAMKHVQRNVQSLRRSLAGPTGSIAAAGGAACQWDVQSLPLRDGSVDVMVVDM